MTTPDVTAIKNYLLNLQDNICGSITELDGGTNFSEDNWQRPQGGGGRTRVIQLGNHFDSAGVNFSHVMGDNLPASATAHRPELAGRNFTALGISLVFRIINFS